MKKIWEDGDEAERVRGGGKRRKRWNFFLYWLFTLNMEPNSLHTYTILIFWIISYTTLNVNGVWVF